MIFARFAFALAGLVAVSACSPSAEVPAAPQATPVAQVVSGATGAEQAVACMAYLALKQTALEAQTPAGDVTAVRAALGAWEDEARKTMPEDQVAQYFASSIAVEDDATPAKMEATSAWCLANAPAA